MGQLEPQPLSLEEIDKVACRRGIQLVQNTAATPATPTPLLG